MAANNDMNGDEFGRYGDEFVDLEEEFDEQGGGINPEEETEQRMEVGQTKAVALCAKR